MSANLTEALMASGKMSVRRSRSTLPSLSSDVKKDIQANNETAAERLQRALLESQQQEDSGRHRIFQEVLVRKMAQTKPPAELSVEAQQRKVMRKTDVSRIIHKVRAAPKAVESKFPVRAGANEVSNMLKRELNDEAARIKKATRELDGKRGDDEAINLPAGDAKEALQADALEKTHEAMLESITQTLSLSLRQPTPRTREMIEIVWGGIPSSMPVSRAEWRVVEVYACLRVCV